jgi:hypothetical protein
MEFENLTPFAVQPFGGYDVKDQEYHIVVMRVGYDLVGVGETGLFKGWVLDREPVDLVMTDEYHGAPNVTSLKAESDLAPYKPKCDVLVVGKTHAPGGMASREWEAGLRVGYGVEEVDLPRPPEAPKAKSRSEPVTHEDVKRWMEESAAYRKAVAGKARWKLKNVVLEKRIRVQGQRQFQEGLLGWKASKAEAVKCVPLKWEHAFGGNTLVRDESGAEILNEAWFANPVGCGWRHPKWISALGKAKQKVPKSLMAPQLFYPDDVIGELDQTKTPEDADTARKMAAFIREKARHRPAGLGYVGKSWAPRLALAGTYDERWQGERWPYLPKDFDFRYWNGAPEDQQIGFPEPGLTLELSCLMNPEKSGRDTVFVQLPAHRAFVLARLGGLSLPFPMQVDTVVIDTEAMRIDLVWRTGILRSLEPEKLEARFETNPELPLLKFRSEEEENGDGAGVREGIESGTAEANGYPKTRSGAASAERQRVARDADEFWMNGA